MYKRVLLKMSGEAIKGDTPFGIDPATVQSIAKQIKAPIKSFIFISKL